MTQASPVSATSDSSAPEATMREAFLELHGRRLHGFALVLTLGDRGLAARLTADALAAGAARIPGLRHPERAAAWLRYQVLRSMPRRHHGVSPAEERAALEPLGAGPAVADGLAALKARERAALIAADVERLDLRDVETIVAASGPGLERMLARARRRYLNAHAAVPIVPDADEEGSLVRRIRAVAARTMT